MARDLGWLVRLKELDVSILQMSSTSIVVDPYVRGALQCRVYELDGNGLQFHPLPAVFPAKQAKAIYRMWRAKGLPLNKLFVANPKPKKKKCRWCGKRAHNKCTECQFGHRARYCNRDCQRQDWFRHMYMC